MSIATTTRKAGPFTGNGVTTVFPFSFKVFTASDLTVVSTTEGLDTTLVLNSSYSVVLNSNQDTSPGGTVTLFVAPASSYTITITSAVAQTQPVVLTNNGGFYPTVINNALDRLTILIQQLAEGLSRSLKISLSSSTAISTTLPVPVANKAIGWNSTATGFANLDVATGGGGGGGAVSSVNGQTGAVVLTAAGLGAVTSVNGQTGPAVTLVTGVSSVNGSTGAVTVTPASISAVATTARGTANGVASLDSSGLVPSSQLPTSGSYKGTWNATTNTPTIVSGVGVNGDFYKVATAGSTTIDGVSSWAIGDEIRFGTSTWQKIANSAAVSSVNGLTGAVVLTAAGLGAVTSVNGKTGAAVTLAAADVGADLTPSSGSASVGHIGNGTGPVAMTVQTKLRQTVNVKDYGATGDGTTNDTTAIQNAINASGGIIYFPAGTYSITALTLAAGKQLIGENRETSILKLRSAMTTGNGMVNGTSLTGIVIRNLTFDGSLFASAVVAQINLLACDGAIIESNNFINTDRFAIGCNSMNRWVARDNKFIMPQHVGVWIDGIPAPSGGTTPTGTVYNGTVSAPTGSNPIQAAFTYRLNASNQIIPSYVIFSHNGAGYLTVPTVTFPAATSPVFTAHIGGSQVVAITASNSITTGENVEISHNYFEGGGTNLALQRSAIFGNVGRNIIYGATFVEHADNNVGQNRFYSNTSLYGGYCTLTGASYTNTFIGPDTDNTVTTGFELWGILTTAENNFVYYNAGVGISFGCRNGLCSNNTCYDNGQYWASIGNYNTYGIQLPEGNAGSGGFNHGSYAIVQGNRSFDQNGATGKQGYGIGVAGPLVVSFKIVDNDASGNRTSDYNMNGATPGVLRDISSSGSGVSLATTAPAAVGTTAVVGVGTTAARADHVHIHGAQTDGTLHAAATTSVAGFMSAADKTKLDSTATLSSAIPASVGAQTAGVATTASRSDHIHDHGNQTAGTHHAAATTSVAGFMSTTDKTKLDSLSTAVATTTVNGLMSAADKTKLDAVSNGAILTVAQSFAGATIASGAIGGQGATLAGVAFGDYLDVSFSFPLQNCTAMAFVTAANGVQCIFTNNTGASVTLAAGTVYFRAMKR